jgi:hypothetical protein
MTRPAIHGHQVGDQFPGHRQRCAIGVALLFFVVNMRRECRASHTNQRQRTGKDGLTLQPNLGAALCKDVTEMITKFEKEVIPHEAGARFRLEYRFVRKGNKSEATQCHGTKHSE